MSDLVPGNIPNADVSLIPGAVPNHRSDLKSLVRFSARIGRDPLLVQASSGNTSVKLNGTLWVKASGKWLARADEQDILVPVTLSTCLERFEQGGALNGCNAALSPEGLRPSIETFMHALLPQRFVAHVHCVDAIAWAIRSDATEQLADKLRGFRWKWIPYVPSGLPLAREVQSACSTRLCPDVLVLGNHGLVICGPTCSGVEALLSRVQRRLAIQPRPVAKPAASFVESASRLSSWRLPDFEVIQTLATDVTSRRIATRGVLYPCQAMFLGDKLAVLPRGKDLEQLDPSRPFVIVEGKGVLVNRNITAAESAVLTGFAEVLRRIDASAPIRYLTRSEVSEAVNADAHRYRISVEEQSDFPAFEVCTDQSAG